MQFPGALTTKDEFETGEFKRFLRKYSKNKWLDFICREKSLSLYRMPSSELINLSK